MRRLIPASLVLAAACVESRDAPPLVDQATITYGDRIYLVDSTRNEGRNAQSPCARLGTVATSTDALGSTDGLLPAEIDPLTPHNCFVQVAPKALTVDAVEVTNELYQLCIDSEACRGPDPSQVERAQYCRQEENFDVCPVVEVPQSEAQNFCAWIGRRLPSTIEAIAIRQAALDTAQRVDPTQLMPFPTGDTRPEACDDAVMGGGSCMATKPEAVLDDNGQLVGGGARDRIDPPGSATPIYDLMGNASEWTNDRIASQRGNAVDLPWFCVAALPPIETSSTSTTTPTPPPTCPENPDMPGENLTGLACVYGQYKPAPDLPLGIYPVCLTNATGGFAGDIGVLAGGSYRDDATDLNDERDFFGTWARRVQSQPDDLAGEALARQYGFRCVDDRESAPADGEVPPFMNELELLRLP
ncbi:MAG: SUMF1/EgtB/PvdO family nonheme iron enzyme [Deltaproteobacteria bacterium]